jgi:hypothetical protein
MNAETENVAANKRLVMLPRWLRTHPYTALAVVFFLTMTVPFCSRKFSEWDEVFVRAAATMWHGQDIYEVRALGYAYPPFMAWLAIPFALLPGGMERLLFYVINVVCVTLLCRWAWRLAGGGRLQNAGTSRSEHIAFALGLLCAFRYVLDGLAHQQVDMIIGCLVLGGCLALSRSRNWLGATAFGLAAAMKCTAVLFVPYLLWRRRWLPALWLAVVAVGVNFLPDLVSGGAPSGRPWALEWYTRFLAPLGDQNPGEWGSDIVFNQSLAGLCNRYGETRWSWQGKEFAVIASPTPLSPGVLRATVYASEALLAVAALMAFGLRPRKDTAGPSDAQPSHRTLELSMVLTLMLLFSPMSSKPHFCTLLLPAFYLARQALTGARLAAAFLALATVTSCLSIRGIWGDALSTFGLWWGSITWSTLCLFAGCWYELYRARRASAEVPPVLACASGSFEYRRAG